MLAFAMATGVDQNPVQAIYCVVLMAGALVCIKSAERMERRASDQTPQTPRKVYDYQAGTFRDVA